MNNKTKSDQLQKSGETESSHPRKQSAVPKRRLAGIKRKLRTDSVTSSCAADCIQRGMCAVHNWLTGNKLCRIVILHCHCGITRTTAVKSALCISQHSSHIRWLPRDSCSLYRLQWWLSKQRWSTTKMFWQIHKIIVRSDCSDYHIIIPVNSFITQHLALST